MRSGEEFERLVEIMARLRAPDGCPWDQEQTLSTLRQYLVEETYEVLEAIEDGTPREHCEELGDLLLQVVFHARIREEEGHFDVADVAQAISDKLWRRHPHVFGEAQTGGETGAKPDADQVVRNWSDLKAKEGKKCAIDGVPRAMPALQRALRVGEKAASAGFDWRGNEGVFEKLREEELELRAAIEQQDKVEMERELGDYLFTVVNLARRLGIDPEAALRGTVNRFESRFRTMEGHIKALGQSLRELPDDELERRWQAAKLELSRS